MEVDRLELTDCLMIRYRDTCTHSGFLHNSRVQNKQRTRCLSILDFGGQVGTHESSSVPPAGPGATSLSRQGPRRAAASGKLLCRACCFRIGDSQRTHPLSTQRSAPSNATTRWNRRGPPQSLLRLLFRATPQSWAGLHAAPRPLLFGTQYKNYGSKSF